MHEQVHAGLLCVHARTLVAELAHTRARVSVYVLVCLAEPVHGGGGRVQVQACMCVHV